MLVSKLDEVINDNTLPELGVVKIRVEASSTPSLTTTVYKNTESPYGDALLYLNEGEGKGEIQSSELPVNNPSVIRIKSKYAIQYLRLRDTAYSAHIDISEFSSCVYMKNLELRNVNLSGDFSALASCDRLDTIYIDCANNKEQIDDIDISVLSKNTELVSIKFNPKEKKLIGNISSLGALTHLTKIDVSGSHVSGTIEDFVKAQIAHGRTTENTGIIIPWGQATDITFNGLPLKASATATLTWSGANSIQIV